MRTVIYSGIVFLCSISAVMAAADVERKELVKTVSYEHVLNWSLGLIIVLCLFFACVWFVRKMGVLPVNPKQSMRVIAGISLGMREKLVLVQVGEKQLVLGVTPGRIDNLLVLEGSDQLLQERPDSRREGEFSQKLKHLMTGSTNE